MTGKATFMRVTRVRGILWGTAAAATAGAVAALVATVRLPLEMNVPRDPVVAPPARVSQAQDNPPLEWFEPAWRVSLRRPLVDPPAVVAAASEQAAAPAPRVRLVGTIIDGRRPRGIFVVGLASVEVKGVGDKAGGADIIAIDDNTATLSFGGATFVLNREKRPFNPDGDTPTASSQTGPGGGS